MTDVTIEEVAEQFRKAIRGDVSVRLVDPENSFDKCYCGDVEFWFGNWKITFFNDCDELDYTDSVVTDDGRKADFLHDWGKCPMNSLGREEALALEILITEAK